MWVGSLGRGNPVEKGKATYSNVLAWRIPWTEESGGLPGGSVVESADDAGDMGYVGSIPGSGRSLGEGNGNPLQYSCLENPMDRGAWQATVHGVTKSWT